ncbi:MAG: S-layer homology domain-containing protein [Firmicutes bacterium]|nr:S-layer homology domain-containing protein [Bacillota bacterium]
MSKRERKSFARRATVIVLAVVMVFAFSVTAFAAGTVEYTDVPAGHWAEATIKEAAANGLDMKTGTEFQPDVAITRAEFCHMVAWAFGLETCADRITFKDVSKSSPYYDAIRMCVYSDIIHGRSAEVFDPDSPITRQEACILFYNMLPLYGVSATGKVEEFADYSEITAWALKEVGVITNAGFVQGYPDGTIKPLREITKAEALTLITRIVNACTIVHGDFTTKNGDNFKDTIFTGKIYVPAGTTATFDNCSLLGKLVSGTTKEKTQWELPHETKVANVEYTNPVTPTPNPPPTPTEPDDEDWDGGWGWPN